jgi:predicted HicB family RNase H-like nuclease
MKKSDIAKNASRYVKVIEWSAEDRCFIGSAPPLVGQCCHGTTEAEVLRQLRAIVKDVIEMMLKHGDPLPAPTAGKKYSGNFVVRLAPGLHQKAALKALARGKSLNEFVAEALAKA